MTRRLPATTKGAPRMARDQLATFVSRIVVVFIWDILDPLTRRPRGRRNVA